MKYQTITAESWPGPENQGVFSMAQRHGDFFHSTLLALVSQGDFDAAVANQVQKIGDPGGDAYDIASTKVWLAAWILVMHKLCSDSAIEIPSWLAEENAIVMSGRYPIGYTDSSQSEMLVLGS
jgi:hypothetical protein